MEKNIKYPYLPKNRAIKYVPENNKFMKIAKETAINKSTDQMQPTGAVIVKNGEIISKGANQSKLKSKRLRNIHKNGLCVRRILKIPSGKSYWLCPGCSTYEQHAENQAVIDAKNNKKDTIESDLYLWGHWWCCEPCWNSMIKAGIENVYLMEGSETIFNKNHKK
ncbi:MAG: deaminase [Candidatus Paceibacterota bacterium]